MRSMWPSALRRGLFLTLAIGVGCAACSGAADRRLNVLVISADTLSRSALRVFDPAGEELPTVESLAAVSVLFDQAYSTSSWTLPAHASLLTGLYPDRHGATHEKLRISASAEKLAERLRRAGYETVAFTGGGYVDGSYGFDSGFDRFNSNWTDPDLCCFPLPRGGQYDEVPGRSLFDRTTAYLRARSSSAPFFLFVQTYSIHDYFKVHPWAGAEHPERLFQSPEYYAQCLYGEREGTAEDWAALRDLYRSEVRHFDRGLGRLLGELDALGLRESTVIVLVSDHGEGLTPELGRIHHGGRLHADLLRVPLMVSGPGITPAVRQEALSLVDVMPTLLEFLGLEVPAGLDGRSFISALRGGEPVEERPIFAHEFMYAWMNGSRKQSEQVLDRPVSIAVIDGGQWYIRGEISGEEFYDGRRDPELLHNSAGHAAELGRLRSLLELREHYRPPVEFGDDIGEVDRRLRQLGY